MYSRQGERIFFEICAYLKEFHLTTTKKKKIEKYALPLLPAEIMKVPISKEKSAYF